MYYSYGQYVNNFASNRQKLNADVNFDGVIDTIDVAMIIQKALDSEYEFGANSQTNSTYVTMADNIIADF